MSEGSDLPGGADTHLHFYDRRYPSAPAAVLHPADAAPSDYRRVQTELGLDRLVVVQPTTYGLDNRCQLDAMAEFGDAARAVVVVDAATSDDELDRLHGLGARGARFHMLPGGAVGWDMLEPVARRIARLGWHIQLQLNGRELAARHEQLVRLPVEVVIDHIGRFMPPVSVDDSNFLALVDLVERGRAWVKLSAPYESSAEPISDRAADHRDVTPLIDALVGAVADRLLWASNWPHPGQRNPPSPRTLSAQFRRWVPDADTRRRIAVDNADQLYFHDTPTRRTP